MEVSGEMKDIRNVGLKDVKSRKTPKKNPRDEVEIRSFGPEHIAEYEWPLNSGKYHFIEEYLMNYLGVKKLRRRYTNMERRWVQDLEERQFLLEKKIVTVLQCDLGLIAIPSEQVREIIGKDFKEKLQEYQEFKARVEYREKVKEIQEQRSEMDDLESIRRKSMKACSAWNFTVNKRVKRKYPRKEPEMPIKAGRYPLALIPGQYVDCPQRYTAEELLHFPLKTVIHEPPEVFQVPNTLTDATGEDEESAKEEGSDSETLGSCLPDSLTETRCNSEADYDESLTCDDSSCDSFMVPLPIPLVRVKKLNM